MKRAVYPVSLAILVAILIGFVRADETEPVCRIPNPSIKKCYSPTNGIVCANSSTKKTCEGYFAYEINDFPDGTLDSPTGLTQENQRECWRSTPCIWKLVTQTEYACVADLDNVGPWILGNKIEEQDIPPGNACAPEEQ